MTAVNVAVLAQGFRIGVRVAACGSNAGSAGAGVGLVRAGCLDEQCGVRSGADLSVVHLVALATAGAGGVVRTVQRER